MLPFRLQEKRVDKEGWGSPNTSPPVILMSGGTPARIRPYSLIIMRICSQCANMHLSNQVTVGFLR